MGRKSTEILVVVLHECDAHAAPTLHLTWRTKDGRIHAADVPKRVPARVVEAKQEEKVMGKGSFLAWLLAVALVGCGAAAGAQDPGGPEGDAGQVEAADGSSPAQDDAGQPRDGAAGAKPKDAGDASTGAQDAAQPPTAQQVQACMAKACADVGAACGTVAGDCYGEPVQCGACGVKGWCGDNGVLNQCGMFCIDNYAQQCQNAGYEWGVSLGCHDRPYKLSTDGTTATYRAGGVSGCVAVAGVQCCP